MTIIAIANQKGGTGKTTTTVNLAHHIGPTQLIDLDVHHGLSNINTLRDKPHTIYTATTENELIKLLRHDGTTLIDCGGYDGQLIRLAIANADIVIVPTTDDPTEQFGLANFNDVLADISKEVGEPVQAHVLINRVHPSRRQFDDINSLVYSLPHLELLQVGAGTSAVIPQNAAITRAMFKGEAVTNGTVAATYNRTAMTILNLATQNV